MNISKLTVDIQQVTTGLNILVALWAYLAQSAYSLIDEARITSEVETTGKASLDADGLFLRTRDIFRRNRLDGRKSRALVLVLFVVVVKLASTFAPLLLRQVKCDDIGHYGILRGKIFDSDGIRNLRPPDLHAGQVAGPVLRYLSATGQRRISAGRFSEEPDYLPVEGTSNLVWEWGQVRSQQLSMQRVTFVTTSSGSFSESSIFIEGARGKVFGAVEQYKVTEAFNDLDLVAEMPVTVLFKESGSTEETIHVATLGIIGQTIQFNASTTIVRDLTVSQHAFTVTRERGLGCSPRYMLASITAARQRIGSYVDMPRVLDAAVSIYELGVAAGGVVEERDQVRVYKTCTDARLAVALVSSAILVNFAVVAILKLWISRFRYPDIGKLATKNGIMNYLERSLEPQGDCAHERKSTVGLCATASWVQPGLRHLEILIDSGFQSSALDPNEEIMGTTEQLEQFWLSGFLDSSIRK
jgi:hypothetical protein